MAGPGRTILHLDLDAFYASVEQLDDPALRGRPVIVGRHLQPGRGLRRQLRGPALRGPLGHAHRQARRLCPEGVFLHPRFSRYGELSDRVFGIYRRYTPLVEPLSLDEAFLDVTASRALHGDGPSIAGAIKREVRAETGLAVSAGVAEVKLAAKIATDFGKPDGLVVVPPGGVAAFLAPLPVGRLWGVGGGDRGGAAPDRRSPPSATWRGCPSRRWARRSAPTGPGACGRWRAATTSARWCRTRRRGASAARRPSTRTVAGEAALARVLLLQAVAGGAAAAGGRACAAGS